MGCPHCMQIYLNQTYLNQHLPTCSAIVAKKCTVPIPSTSSSVNDTVTVGSGMYIFSSHSWFNEAFVEITLGCMKSYVFVMFKLGVFLSSPFFPLSRINYTLSCVTVSVCKHKS